VRWRLRFGLVVAAAGVGLSCGPSVQSIYEGNVRFEHCYRLDIDSRKAAPHREACWRQWTRDYAYGQTRDRIEYARRRIRVLASGDATRTVLNVEGEAETQERQFYIVMPVPTSAHAPPPAVAVPYRAPPEGVASPAMKTDGGLPSVGLAGIPGQQCAGGCQNAWQKCTTPCADGGSDARCVKCEADYRTCMQRCFQ
jgi:hypothetical protein